MKKILIIGDICLDVWQYGYCYRMNPEVPSLVFNTINNNKKKALGMGGNVLEWSKTISSKYFNNEIEIEGLFPYSISDLVDQEVGTVKKRFVDLNSNYIVFREDTNDVSPNRLIFMEPFLETDKIISLTENYLSHFDGVIFADYNKGFLSEETLERIINFCFANGIITFIDTKKTLGPWSTYVDFVKINTKEYLELKRNVKDPTIFCRGLVVTKGPNGADFYFNPFIEGDGKLSIPIPDNLKHELKDVCGAGDSFMSALALNYIYNECENKNLVLNSIEFANKIASLSISLPRTDKNI